jgi:hypothetical protein
VAAELRASTIRRPLDADGSVEDHDNAAAAAVPAS